METPNNEEVHIEIPEGNVNINAAKEVLVRARANEADKNEVDEMIKTLQNGQRVSEEARNDLGVRAVLAGLIATRTY